MTTNNILIIPDYHAHPDYDDNRAKALGNMILELQPDKVLMLGDWADMPSLSSYDKGKRSFEGRRYQRDVAASISAQEILWGPVNAWNAQQRKNRKAQYNPLKIMLRGNHCEGRIEKVTNLHPELHGTISVEDLGYERYWDVIVPFRERIILDGFAISHYFTSGNSDQAIGGLHQAYNLLVKNSMSSIVGHSHMLDIKRGTKADGSKTLAISAGCFTHPDHIEGWNMDTQYKWWNGIVLLQNAQDGDAEAVLEMTQKAILRDFG